MADTYRLEVTNAAAFDAALTAAGAGLADLGQPLEAAARAVVAASNPPRDTGAMAAAQRVTPAGPNRVRITVDTAYAAVIHWGWPGHGIRRRPWIVATWQRDTAPRDKIAQAVQTDLDRAAARA